MRTAVITFGSRLKLVSLLAPDTAVERAMQTQYGGLAAPLLLRKWAADPRHAPGRLTSSPWPDRIDVANVSRKSNRVFLVDGEIVERTSANAGADADRIPVRLAVWRTAGTWVITEYDQGAPLSAGTAGVPAGDDAPEHAVAVVRAYYDAINARQYERAYRMWEADGAASGQSMMEFLNGYVQTKSVQASIGTPGPMGAAAGSRYVEVPVRLVSTSMTGARESYSGTITLRRSVVDGATPKQRTWQIYAAKLKKEPAA